MAQVKVVLPRMGEGISEATVINYLKSAGDRVEAEEPVVEIATDKVDSEVLAPAAGILTEVFFKKDDVVKVGQTLAVIETEGGEESVPKPSPASPQKAGAKEEPAAGKTQEQPSPGQEEPAAGKTQEQPSPGQEEPAPAVQTRKETSRFYSPLVKNIAKTEGISPEELDSVPGTGAEGRVTKDDILAYVASRGKPGAPAVTSPAEQETTPPSKGDQVMPMSRMRRLIAAHMVSSVQTSPHVTSVVQADVTAVSRWRTAAKDDFLRREGEKLTFTPIFVWAVSRALRDYPMINVSVDGDNIVKHSSVNIGMAVALPSGDLIVPVIKNADMLSLAGLAKAVNDLSARARAGKLKPDEIQGGTFSITNLGSFGTLIGTPIINQPEAAILGLGAIEKTPAVVQVSGQDAIAIREMMYLCLSYDHRVVDGALGGMFLKRVAGYLEDWKDDFPY